MLSVSVPDTGLSPLSYLDQHHICASGGSACNSRSGKGSHVLGALGTDPDSSTIRFSFSRYNTAEEIDYTADKLAGLFAREIVNEIEVVTG
ncbi:Cysteine desulfurase [compost metagenome]